MKVRKYCSNYQVDDDMPLFVAVKEPFRMHLEKLIPVIIMIMSNQ